MTDWTIFVPTFLAATVEWVEAFTIVLAVSLSIGWPRALSAAASALVFLAAMTIVTGGVLNLGVGMSALELLIEPYFPRRVIATYGDIGQMVAAMIVIAILASVFAVRRAMRVDPRSVLS